MPGWPALKADCSRCAALCCIALAFDKSDLFGIDKEAGVPCPHLDAQNRCRIHPELKKWGFGGCLHYDCLGAGQRVVQDVFGGRSWRDDASLLPPMMDAFRTMRKIHELLDLLRLAGKLSLTEVQRREHAMLVRQLNPADGWDRAGLERFEAGPLAQSVEQFLQGLRTQVDSLALFPEAKQC